MPLLDRATALMLIGLLSAPEMGAVRLSRRKAFERGLTATGFGALLGAQGAQPAAAFSLFGSEYKSAQNVPGYQTPAGVKYYDLQDGQGRQPEWGDTVVISFTQYIQKNSDEAPKKIDDFGGSTFVFKHGNGRQIDGLEDGVHTMKVGGVRRLLVPARLAYVRGNLGPIPRSTMEIKKLENALDEMEASGQIIFDVSLMNAFRDEADRGYYQDDVPGTKETAVPSGVMSQQASKDAL